MSLYNGPPRGGARGGKDQFSWENVKSDKDREFYLGHSVKASVGRWQKGKDLLWYTKEKQDDGNAAVLSELAAVKATEEELMMEALGLKPKTVKPKVQPQLDKLEMKRLLEKGEDEEEDEAGRTDADQIKGIGYHSGQIMGAGEAAKEVMAGVGTSRLIGQASNAGLPSTRQLPLPPKLSGKELKKLRKAQKKEIKRTEKEAKKQAKKEARKEAKRAKKAKEAEASAKINRRNSSSDSSSGSEASGSPSLHPAKRAKTADEGEARVRDDGLRRSDRSLREADERGERLAPAGRLRDNSHLSARHGSRRDSHHSSPDRRRRPDSPNLISRSRHRSRSPDRWHRRRHDSPYGRR